MRIGELAARTGVSVRSLRYYEEQGMLAPHRSLAGHRVYRTEDEAVVRQIRELFDAGFCSSVIQELLPSLIGPVRKGVPLQGAFAAARSRLESEMRSIETELYRLDRLEERLGLASDTHVTPEDGDHDSTELSPPIAFDHRDRRLR